MTAVTGIELERRIGRRIIRAGDVVAIEGFGHARVQMGRELVPGFRVLGFRGDVVHVYGAKTGLRAPAVRTFPVSKIGRRPRPRPDAT